MKVKVGFKLNDSVIYTHGGEKLSAKIVEIIPEPGTMHIAEYKITITTNRGKAYRKGATFRTTSQFLSLRSRARKKDAQAEKRKADNKELLALKELAGK